LTGCFCSVSVLSCFFFSSRRRHTRFSRDWSSDVCSSDLVPRLQGHSAQDTQAYKSEELLKAEWARDPLPRLESFLVGLVMSEGRSEERRVGKECRSRRSPCHYKKTRDTDGG